VLVSCKCKRSVLQGFSDTVTKMDEKFRIHRKLWEWVAVYDAAVDLMLELGRPIKALGFGVGKEPLSRCMNNAGMDVTATDGPHVQNWYDTEQHATNNPELSWSTADMNYIPIELRRGRFDLTWSCSAMEHLGSIDKGVDFLCSQMGCLRDGGLAVHTTEFNYRAKWATQQADTLVFFRKRDIRDMSRRLSNQKDLMWPVDFSKGGSYADTYIDSPPYQDYPHLNLRLGTHVTTSILIVVERGGCA